MRRAVAAGILAVLLAACTGSPVAAPSYADARALADAASAATLQARSATFTTDVSAGSIRSKGQGRARFGDGGTTQDMTTDALGDPLELVMVAKTLYAKVPDASRGEIGDGKPWVQVSPDGSDPFSQVLGGSLGQLAAQNDPVRTFGEIRAAGTMVSAERGTLDGVAGEHYRVDLALDKLGDDLPAGLSPDQAGPLRGKVAGFPVELWLDERHRPMQIVLDLSPILTAAGAPDGASAKITTRYSAWGTPVDVQAPPPDQVGPLTSGG